MSNLGLQPLFDKLIDITLLTQNKTEGLVLRCPRLGIKPDISIKGSFMANILYNAELRIKNFYSPIDIGPNPDDTSPSYTFIHIDAGYASGMHAAMDGQIWVAYQASPPPDGDTVFQFFTGIFTEWVTAPFDRNYTEDWTINNVIRDVCAKASAINPDLFTVELNSAIPDDRHLSSKIDANTTIGDFCFKLGRNENLVITPMDQAIRVIDKRYDGTGTGVVHVLDYISDIRKVANTYTITAPWVPAVHPWDTVYVEPKYYSSDVSGMFVKIAPDMLVLNVDFEFDTNGSANRMVLQTLARQI